MEKQAALESCTFEAWEPILCSVCIATYRRPDLLEKLLRSLEGQYLPNRVSMEIIVVDNDPRQSAAPILTLFRNTPHLRFFYCVQPQKNISFTRNTAVAHACGQYLLFIDDDEAASELWLYSLLKTLVVYDADAVFGPVVPDFNKDAPHWMRRKEFFYPRVEQTGAPARFAWAGNCIVKAALLKTEDVAFSPSYGITGGEDTHLFDRLEQKGARFVCCEEALVFEYLPRDRTRVSYLFVRWLKGGNAHTRRCIEFAGKERLKWRLFMLGKAVSFGMASFILTAFFLPLPVWRTHWLMRLGSNIGRFMAVFHWHYKGYR